MKGLGLTREGYGALAAVVVAAVMAQIGFPIMAWALVATAIFLSVLVARDALE